MRRFAGWLVVGGLAVLTVWTAEKPVVEVREGPVQRLFGPVASLAAQVEWIRFDRARMSGRPHVAIPRAYRALALDPGDTRGWDVLASHLAFDLASMSREQDPEVRLHWTRSALAIARRGEEVARDPGRLAYLRGLILVMRAENDPDLPWPGGEKALWEEAARAFLRAEELGYPHAEAAAVFALEQAAGH